MLLDTITHLMKLEAAPSEILVVDQTEEHDPKIMDTLCKWDAAGVIRWIRLSLPSIPHAMNIGLKEARYDIVLFLDDDILPDKSLIAAHMHAHTEKGYNIVAGQVLQPGEEPLLDDERVFSFRSNRSQWIQELMAGNFSIMRKMAFSLGGFDENFVHVAYRFETDFADRALDAGEKIFFEPAASIRHLKVLGGGTRSFGEHLKTMKPSHSVGEYYYLMRSKRVQHRLIRIMSRPLRAIRTKHHLRNPWWIPLTLVSEFLGFSWAIFFFLRGPRYISVLNSALKQ